MSEEEIKECLDSLYYQDDVCSITYDKLKDYIIKLKTQLQQKENIIKEVREKVENFDVFKEFTFPLMKKWEEQEVKSSIDYEWNQSIKKPILEILDKENK